MPRGNTDNLISNPERSPEELSNMGKKGGAASGKARFSSCRHLCFSLQRYIIKAKMKRGKD